MSASPFSSHALAVTCCRWQVSSDLLKRAHKEFRDRVLSDPAASVDAMLRSGCVFDRAKNVINRFPFEAVDAVDYDNGHGESLVHLVCRNASSERLATLRVLIRNHGLDPNARDLAGRTPLHTLLLRASASPSLADFVREMLALGADVRATDAAGNSPLAYLPKTKYSENPEDADPDDRRHEAALLLAEALKGPRLTATQPTPLASPTAIALRSPSPSRNAGHRDSPGDRRVDSARSSTRFHFAVLLVDTRGPLCCAAPVPASARSAVRGLGSPLSDARQCGVGSGLAAEAAAAWHRAPVVETRRLYVPTAPTSVALSLRQCEDPTSGYAVAAALGPFSGPLAAPLARFLVRLWTRAIARGESQGRCLAACDFAAAAGAATTLGCPHLGPERARCDFHALAAMFSLQVAALKPKSFIDARVAGNREEAALVREGLSAALVAGYAADAEESSRAFAQTLEELQRARDPGSATLANLIKSKAWDSPAADAGARVTANHALVLNELLRSCDRNEYAAAAAELATAETSRVVSKEVGRAAQEGGAMSLRRGTPVKGSHETLGAARRASEGATLPVTAVTVAADGGGDSAEILGRSLADTFAALQLRDSTSV